MFTAVFFAIVKNWKQSISPGGESEVSPGVRPHPDELLPVCDYRLHGSTEVSVLNGYRKMQDMILPLRYQNYVF